MILLKRFFSLWSLRPADSGTHQAGDGGGRARRGLSAEAESPSRGTGGSAVSPLGASWGGPTPGPVGGADRALRTRLWWRCPLRRASLRPWVRSLRPFARFPSRLPALAVNRPDSLRGLPSDVPCRRSRPTPAPSPFPPATERMAVQA